MSAQPVIAPASHHGRTATSWTPVVLPGGELVTVGSTAPAGHAVPSGRAQRDVLTSDRRSLAPATRAAAWRRRAAVAALPAAIALGLTTLLGGGTADAELDDPVAGTVTIEPGQTLWDVAAATAPDGTDTRDQLGRIVELNAFDPDRIEPWTVVLVPAR